MRRLLFFVAFLMLPLAAGAQHREALLTPDGTLFTIESQSLSAEPEGSTRGSHLVLKSQLGETSQSEVVPASKDGDSHTDAAMAYEPESRTLFVFWIRHMGLMGSELLIACRNQDGTWTDATAFGEQFDFRENLRIATTRRVVDESGAVDTTPSVSVHLVWWEFDSDDGAESARYAMVSIDDGKVSVDQSLELGDFTKEAEVGAEEADRELLKQPMLFSSAKQDSVEVIFGDFRTNRLHQVTIQPTRKIVADGRLRVPVGRISAPPAKAPRLITSDSRVDGVFGDATRMALYTRDDKQVRYVILKDGAWSEPQAITLSDQLNGSAAVDALRRLVNEH